MISPDYRSTVEAYTESRKKSAINNAKLDDAVSEANKVENRRDAYTTISSPELKCDKSALPMEFKTYKGKQWIKFVGKSMEKDPNQARIQVINHELVKLDRSNREPIKRRLYERFYLGEDSWDEPAIEKESETELVRIGLARLIAFNLEAWPSDQLHLVYAILKAVFKSFDSKKRGNAVASALPWDSSVEAHERERERIITAPLSKGISTATSLASASTRSRTSSFYDNDNETAEPTAKYSIRDRQMPGPSHTGSGNINTVGRDQYNNPGDGRQYNAETQNFYYGKIYNDTTHFGPYNQDFQAGHIGRNVNDTNFHNSAADSSQSGMPESALASQAAEPRRDEDAYDMGRLTSALASTEEANTPHATTQTEADVNLNEAYAYCSEKRSEYERIWKKYGKKHTRTKNALKALNKADDEYNRLRVSGEAPTSPPLDSSAGPSDTNDGFQNPYHYEANYPVNTSGTTDIQTYDDQPVSTTMGDTESNQPIYQQMPELYKENSDDESDNELRQARLRQRIQRDDTTQQIASSSTHDQEETQPIAGSYDQPVPSATASRWDEEYQADPVPTEVGQSSTYNSSASRSTWENRTPWTVAESSQVGGYNYSSAPTHFQRVPSADQPSLTNPTRATNEEQSGQNTIPTPSSTTMNETDQTQAPTHTRSVRWATQLVNYQEEEELNHAYLLLEWAARAQHAAERLKLRREALTFAIKYRDEYLLEKLARSAINPEERITLRHAAITLRSENTLNLLLLTVKYDDIELRALHDAKKTLAKLKRNT